MQVAPHLSKGSEHQKCELFVFHTLVNLFPSSKLFRNLWRTCCWWCLLLGYLTKKSVRSPLIPSPRTTGRHTRGLIPRFTSTPPCGRSHGRELTASYQICAKNSSLLVPSLRRPMKLKRRPSKKKPQMRKRKLWRLHKILGYLWKVGVIWPVLCSNALFSLTYFAFEQHYNITCKRTRFPHWIR